MMLSDVRDYIESLGIAEHVYSGKLDAKKEKSIGVYNSKHEHVYKTAIGGPELESYGTKHITLLVHWNKSQRETEKAATDLFKKITLVREEKINDVTMKFILPIYDLQDVGTVENGIYEMVIEAAVIYEKEGK
ncbi:MAG: hypothetical protein J6B94_08620 [Lachnospiraceae bacterium]|nr:hypothetical protein [Lachnospiraceae bacterium]